MRKRDKKPIGKIVFVAIFVSVVVAAVYLVTRPVPTVLLPPYLDRCIPLTGPYAYDSRPQLSIVVNGVDQTIPANIGIVGTCVRPIFTLSISGVIHVKTDVNRTYTLGDFFLVWGNTYTPDFAVFNKDQIFNHRKDANHNLTMTVNYFAGSVAENRFQDYPLPIDANTTSNPYQITIRYG